MTDNVFHQDFAISEEQRAQLKGHKSLMIWFTGLSGSGKSTVANALEQYLVGKKINTFTLDGDNIRLGINSDLGFSKEDRTENLRRIGHVGKLMVDAGLVCLAAFVSPLNQDRAALKEIIGKERFIEIFVDTPIEVCEARDVKGLYAKARRGEIKDFTGVNAPFEAPEHPDLVIDTSTEELAASVERIYTFIQNKLSL
jgi:adenylyl-sulfate kinase